MWTRFKIILLLLVLIVVYLQVVAAQKNCDGASLFTEKKCLGDEVDSQEKELYRLVNEYRAQNNLPPIPLSDALNIVANRHLLDLILNLNTLTHGWSNCPYDINNTDTWKCVFESPKRLKVNYSGKGYENLYRTSRGNAIPASALEAWKKSPMHNALILNLNNWKNTQFDSCGIAISGQYAAIWFGSASGIKDAVENVKTPGLGITFENAVKGLKEIISITKSSSSLESEQWLGSSSDKSVLLEVAGTQADVSQATISIKIKLEKKSQMNAKNRGVLSVFLNNLLAEWKERENWTNNAIKNLQTYPKVSQTINFENKTITAAIDQENYLSITVKPFNKPTAKEIK
ncbi:hypothetical protein BH10ACI1_BH10ACI1_11410 [soil metagenome]